MSGLFLRPFTAAGLYGDRGSGPHRFGALDVDVIVAINTNVALAAKRGTREVPIVFAAGSDPVAVGLVDSLAARADV